MSKYEFKCSLWCFMAQVLHLKNLEIWKHIVSRKLIFGKGLVGFFGVQLEIVLTCKQSQHGL